MDRSPLGRTGVARAHPVITCPLFGRRTVDELEPRLAGADVVLSDDVLDRIDEIVPPGTTTDPGDSWSADPGLGPAARRCPSPR